MTDVIYQTFRLTAKCSPSQHRRLAEVFGMCTVMYNALVESWRGSYGWWCEDNNRETDRYLSPSRYDLFGMLTGVRADLSEWSALSVKVGRGVICRFERATRSFCDRCREGKTPGYPRLEPRRRWRSVEIPDPSVSMVSPPATSRNRSDRWWRLEVKGMPRLRFDDRNWRLASALGIGSEIAELRVVVTPLRTEVHVVCRRSRPDDVPDVAVLRPVGLDKGLKFRLTTSDGERVDARVVDRQAIRCRQRLVSRGRRGSRSRVSKVESLTRVWRRQGERVRQADFRLAHRLVSEHDAVIVEDLAVGNMLRSRLWSRKMSEQRWAAFDAVLEYKAWKSGIRFEKVNPSSTSTDCSTCGHRQRMPLSARTFECGSCGLVLDRDHNAARNICAPGASSPDREKTSRRHGRDISPW